ncbi:MAG: hypothetical protein J6Q65_06110, partial [Lentisphaeria bacterium]|nr:hypothetical protein [Lentisphaeria bacterium]
SGNDRSGPRSQVPQELPRRRFRAKLLSVRDHATPAAQGSGRAHRQQRCRYASPEAASASGQAQKNRSTPAICRGAVFLCLPEPCVCGRWRPVILLIIIFAALIFLPSCATIYQNKSFCNAEKKHLSGQNKHEIF